MRWYTIPRMTSPTRRLEGALASAVTIPVTPFTSDGEVDLDCYGELIARLSARGIACITANGNTSEFYSLCETEIQATVESALEHAAEAVVIAGVGGDAATAARQARAARDAGVEGVMIHHPVHPFQSAAGWLRYNREIAETVPEIGVIPYIRGSIATPALIGELTERCANVVGVKFAVPDLFTFAACVDTLRDRLVWVCGLAESWAPFFWFAGARGFTTGLANVRPDLSLALLAALQDGDTSHVRSLWRVLRSFEVLRSRNGDANNVSVVKEAMALQGLCERTVRAPISELSEDERREVAAVLDAWPREHEVAASAAR